FGFVHDGNELDWRHEPFNARTDVPLSTLAAEAWENARCAEVAYACYGDVDVSTDGRGSRCGNVTDGKVVASGVVKFPPLCLTAIYNGSLVIEGNAAVTAMSGFDALSFVDGDVELRGNKHLVSLRGLDALQTVSGDLVVEACGSLLSLSQLDKLVVKERFVQQHGSSYVPDEALHLPRRKARQPHTSLEKTEQCEWCSTMFEEDELVGLEGLHGLTSLEWVGGDLRLVGNEELINARGAEALHTVGGSVVLTDNYNLANLEGLDALAQIGGDFIVRRNAKLDSLDSLPALVEVGGSFEVIENEQLAAVGSFAALRAIRGDWIVRRNPFLARFGSGGAQLGIEQVGEKLVIEENRRLVTLQGLENLREVGASLILVHNELLTSLSPGLDQLLAIGGNMYVQGDLPDYSGLDSLRQVNGSVVVHGLRELTSLRGLEALEEVGRDLVVYLNPSLASVSELQGLRRIGNRMLIYENHALASISGLLDALHEVGESLRLESPNRTVHCPHGSGVRAGVAPVIRDTTLPEASQAAAADAPHGNWCTLHCSPPLVVGQGPRLQNCNEASSAEMAEGPEAQRGDGGPGPEDDAETPPRELTAVESVARGGEDRLDEGSPLVENDDPAKGDSDQREAQTQEEYTQEEYTGELLPNGLRHGKGTLVYAGGFFRYSGDWLNGIKHGCGRLDLGAKDNYYEGDFVDGEMTGRGTRRWSSGATYTGEWVLGEMEGEGVLVEADGVTCYEGSFHANKRHGNGTLTLADGSVYMGAFEHHQRTGRGTLECANGDMYHGDFVSGLFEGEGTATWENQDVYRGAWREGKRHGQGRFVDGITELCFEGLWVDDAPNKIPTRLTLCLPRVGESADEQAGPDALDAQGEASDEEDEQEEDTPRLTASIGDLWGDLLNVAVLQAKPHKLTARNRGRAVVWEESGRLLCLEAVDMDAEPPAAASGQGESDQGREQPSSTRRLPSRKRCLRSTKLIA
ncbi:MORN repeat-containing protein 1, partial [Durusdinium trenchii]